MKQTSDDGAPCSPRKMRFFLGAMAFGVVVWAACVVGLIATVR